MDIQVKLACNDAFVTRWTKAFEVQGWWLAFGLAGIGLARRGRVAAAA